VIPGGPSSDLAMPEPIATTHPKMSATDTTLCPE
jgi:hypothetical protein